MQLSLENSNTQYCTKVINPIVTADGLKPRSK